MINSNPCKLYNHVSYMLVVCCVGNNNGALWLTYPLFIKIVIVLTTHVAWRAALAARSVENSIKSTPCHVLEFRNGFRGIELPLYGLSTAILAFFALGENRLFWDPPPPRHSALKDAR